MKKIKFYRLEIKVTNYAETIEVVRHFDDKDWDIYQNIAWYIERIGVEYREKGYDILTTTIKIKKDNPF